MQGLTDFHSPFAARDPGSNHAFHCDDCEVPILATYAPEGRGPGRSGLNGLYHLFPQQNLKGSISPNADFLRGHLNYWTIRDHLTPL